MDAMEDQEYDDEGASPGEGEEEYNESLQQSNAHPYPKQGGLEQRLEQIKNNIKD